MAKERISYQDLVPPDKSDDELRALGEGLSEDEWSRLNRIHDKKTERRNRELSKLINRVTGLDRIRQLFAILKRKPGRPNELGPDVATQDEFRSLIVDLYETILRAIKDVRRDVPKVNNRFNRDTGKREAAQRIVARLIARFPALGPSREEFVPYIVDALTDPLSRRRRDEVRAREIIRKILLHLKATEQQAGGTHLCDRTIREILKKPRHF